MLNFAWSLRVFTLQRVDVAVILVTIAGFIVAALRTDRLSAILFVPYAA